MKTFIFAIIAGISSCLSVYSQEVKSAKYSSLAPDAIIAFTAYEMPPESRTNPDVAAADVSPDKAWLRQFSQALLGRIAYPARGKAYNIAGKMFVNLGIDSNGRVNVLSFGQSLGRDFEQSIIDAVGRVSGSKLKPLALPVAGQLRFSLPILFTP
jgi:outer membrane biosynthesis protein TonB